MKRTALLLAVSCIALSCASTSPRSQDIVSRAVQALGGADALAGVRTVAVGGTVRQWEPEQSLVAGGEMRFACESSFDALADVRTGATRVDWVRKFAYPTPRTFTFSEIVTPTAGCVAGIDSDGRTKQSVESNKLNANLAALVAGVKQAGISPTRFAGAHAGVGDYAPLAALPGS
jgi:hypothetical protein